MGATSRPHDETAPPVRPDWRRRLLLGGCSLAALIGLYFLLAATIPRWWAQRVGDSVHGRLSSGLVFGLLTGVTCTLLPLLVVWFALRRRRPWKVSAAWVAVALVLALPNLWTLSVVVGSGSAAHAGQRTMDVNAPWFRGASLIGAVIGAVVFAALLWFTRRRKPRTG
ncbi:permease [Kitasatospora kifunensis]|uniref:Glucan phosphoethanolaminetransferase (Alkaline phosphatase superfamily) n=1 Tax=Kitasatospora kifunensis TaxID=58351 RepID=A0A7W7QXW0_KITKI|nr:permease [Kitasatospora kifunensis]MBB4921831.1 glucan phosphoethanolaminetransferase (alkaline phosphatase superfamily) [Kitasatospora kifunensis]